MNDKERTIIKNLATLASSMANNSREMTLHGIETNNAQFVEHGGELLRASKIILEWVKHTEKKGGAKQNNSKTKKQEGVNMKKLGQKGIVVVATVLYMAAAASHSGIICD